MQEPMTLSHLADLIIVLSFSGIAGATVGTGLAQLFMFLGKKISAAVKKIRKKSE